MLAIAAPLFAAEEGWLDWLNPDLRHLDRDRVVLQHELERFGSPSVGQTVAEYGYKSPPSLTHPKEPEWVQIDLGSRRRIDCVVLIPALSKWQADHRSAHGFPLRWRIDVSDDPDFAASIPVCDFTAQDYPSPGLGPVVVPLREPQTARHVRISVTKMSLEEKRYFFALAEVMVLSGNLNVAVRRRVTTSGTTARPREWLPQNLVDGRSPLGPPIREEPVPFDGPIPMDGFYIRPDKDVLPEIVVDLGRVYRLQQIRLHPVHARRYSDSPGLGFPIGFQIHCSPSADFVDPRLLHKIEDLTNPGNNPVTLDGRNAQARYLRIAVTEMQRTITAFAEIEIYADGRNIARDAKFTATPDFAGRPARWPESLLHDGLASQGRILELPEWLREWERRRALNTALAQLEQRKFTAIALARQRAWWLAGGGAVAGVTVAGGLLLASRFRRQRELAELRARLARDLHDEIGSNLAGIAVLSEAACAVPHGGTSHPHLQEIHRAARETNAAMREVLWLVGGREEGGADLLSHLRLAASRLLATREVHWTEMPASLPPECSGETARQIFLICKEAMTNIARHSRATRVEIAVRRSEHTLSFEFADNGNGFDARGAHGGLGLASQRSRAAALGGTLEVDSQPGRGTSVRLRVPLPARPAGIRRFPWFNLYALRLAHRR